MHIIGRTGNLPDVQRNNLFEVNIPKPTGITSGWDEEGMLIRARTAKIPSKTIAAIETNFMGMKRFFPGTPSLDDNSLNITFDEFEDQRVIKSLHGWSNFIYDTQNKDRGGHSHADKLSDYVVDISVTLYKNNGMVAGKIIFHNSWLADVGGTDLAYGDADKVTYDAKFQWDWYEIKFN